MMIEIFKPEHVFEMDLRPSEIERLEADPDALGKIIALAQYGVGATLIHGGKIIAVIGYFEMWPGVYEVWAFPSVHVTNNAMLYLRTVRRYIESIEKTHTVHRLQTTAIADDLHDRWMTFLGFKCETPNGMKGFSVLKQTFNMWSRTYDGGAADGW